MFNHETNIMGREKNAWLKQNRGISFGEVLLTIAQGNIVDILEHTNPKRYYGQKIILVNINLYIYCVPFEESNEAIYLKTTFPSRKYAQIYLGKVREQMQPYDESEKKLINFVEQGMWVEDGDDFRKRMRIINPDDRRALISVKLNEFFTSKGFTIIPDTEIFIKLIELCPDWK